VMIFIGNPQSLPRLSMKDESSGKEWFEKLCIEAIFLLLISKLELFIFVAISNFSSTEKIRS
jgi:hypothetical protein